METQYTYDELKELCKQLFIITQTIYGICFVPIKQNPQTKLNAIERHAGVAYNMHDEAVKKGLWN